MTTYQELQQNKRYLKTDIGGNVVLGIDENTNLVVLNIDNFGNVKTIDQSVSDRNVVSSIEINTPGIKSLMLEKTFLKKSLISLCAFNGNGYGEFSIEINDVLHISVRNSYMERTKIVNLKHYVNENDVLKIYARNESFQQQPNTFECYVFFKEVE